MKCTAAPLSLILLLFTSLNLAQNTASEPHGMDSRESIVQNTENSVHHKTLNTAIKAADLEELLDNDGPFTVFAPSDVAFNKLSHERITKLLRPENKKELHSLLTYHMVAGKLSASYILKAMCRGNGKASFTTVQGDEITATMDGIDIVLTDGNGNTAKITTADSNQCNGVIHEIDSVFLPGKI